MRNILTSFVIGLTFALGLGISGMTRPEKVLGFLDIFGVWDPSLIFVMGGAVGVHTLAYRLIRKRKSPLFDMEWHVPTRKDIGRPLVLGSALFGIGWGLSGFCPGPAIVSLASGAQPVWIFVVSMIAGMIAHRLWSTKA